MQFLSRDRLNFKNSSILIGLAIFAILFWVFYPGFLKEARNKYPETILQSILDGELSYYKEFGKFTKDLNNAGFFNYGMEIEVYTSIDEVPKDLIDKIGPEYNPFFSDSDFRFVFLFRKIKTGQDNSVWMLNSRGEKKFLHKY